MRLSPSSLPHATPALLIPTFSLVLSISLPVSQFNCQSASLPLFIRSSECQSIQLSVSFPPSYEFVAFPFVCPSFNLHANMCCAHVDVFLGAMHLAFCQSVSLSEWVSQSTCLFLWISISSTVTQFVYLPVWMSLFFSSVCLSDLTPAYALLISTFGSGICIPLSVSQPAYLFVCLLACLPIDQFNSRSIS